MCIAIPTRKEGGRQFYPHNSSKEISRTQWFVGNLQSYVAERPGCIPPR